MKTPLSLQMTRLALLAAALFLGACVTSVDNNPAATGVVDAQTAGQSLASGFGQAGDWNASTAAPVTQQNLNVISTQVQTGLQKRAGLPKLADLGMNLKFDLSDTGKGFATVSNVTTGLFDTTYDTAVIKWDDKARDSIKNNENVLSFRRLVHHFGGKVETATFADADGDGILNAMPGASSKVRITFTSLDRGVTEETELVAGAGPDDNFDDSADNTVYLAHWTRTQAGALTAETTFEDGDGDGVVADNSKDCVVKVHAWELEPKDKPFVHKSDATATLRVLAHHAGNEPIRFAFSEEMKSGRVNTVTLRNRDGGDSLIKNDTMRVTLETTVAADQDTLKHASIEFVMNPGNDLGSDSDDVLYAINISSEKKIGFEHQAEFHFVPDAPVPHGQQPVSGHFDGKATYADGKSATLSGSFSPTGFSAEFTGPAGNTVKVEYTRNGQVAGGV